MSKGDPNNPTDLSPAGAREYADRIAMAKSGDVPVGGVPMPSIPRLDQPPTGAPRDRGLGVQQAHSQQAGAQQQARSGAETMMSPEQYAQGVQQGQVIPGVGGAYMANQPRGVQSPSSQPAPPPMEITGQGDQPANPPRSAGAGLRPETLEQLEQVAEANAKEEETPEVDKTSEDTDDGYDYNELGRVTKDILSNKERRLAIEAHIKDELNYEDLIINRELRQEVPILPKFRPLFRTPSGEEDLFVKREISTEDGSSQYIMDKYASMGLCCGLYALNGKPLPSHLKDGVPDKELFDVKYKIILKYPMVIVADMSANFTWFTERVQSLLAIDKVQDF